MPARISGLSFIEGREKEEGLEKAQGRRWWWKKKMTRGRPNVVKKRNIRCEELSPPDALDDIAKGEWVRVCGQLRENGALAELYLPAIAGYCEAWSEFVRMSILVKKTGPVTKTEKGNWIQHPLLGVKNQAAERMLRFASQLGMTPVTREKLSTANACGIDDFAKFAGLKLA
jgi:P27 family predicted phage terminase small subunit